MPEDNAPANDDADKGDDKAAKSEENDDAKVDDLDDVDALRALVRESRSHARKWEDRAKANTEARKRLDAIEDEAKTTEQRQTEAIESLTAERDDARVALLRYEVAAEKGLTGDAASLIRGTTRDEIEDSADKVARLIGNASKPRRPAPDASLGREPNTKTSAADQFAAAIDGLI